MDTELGVGVRGDPAGGALCLLSGGLDSQLAVCVLREQGVAVQGVVFESPFFDIAPARRAADALRICLRVADMTEDILGLLERPPHGFGSCMNPCIDCHACMLRRAGELLEAAGARFLATGEVLNERPMSQNKGSLRTVARDSGFEDIVLRPLSARLLPMTRPEREGWVDRERLLDLEGRGRRRQMELARHFGLKEYPTPAGGCRLTEPNYCLRLRDLKGHEGLGDRRGVALLRYGRHFRLADRVKLIVGRNHADNEELERAAGVGDLLLKTEGVPGPTGLLPAAASEEQVRMAAGICARYSDVAGGGEVDVAVLAPGSPSRRVRVCAVAREAADAMRV